jgi:hypothetical protein
VGFEINWARQLCRALLRVETRVPKMGDLFAVGIDYHYRFLGI